MYKFIFSHKYFPAPLPGTYARVPCPLTPLLHSGICLNAAASEMTSPTSVSKRATPPAHTHIHSTPLTCFILLWNAYHYHYFLLQHIFVGLLYYMFVQTSQTPRGSGWNMATSKVCSYPFSHSTLCSFIYYQEPRPRFLYPADAPVFLTISPPLKTAILGHPQGIEPHKWYALTNLGKRSHSPWGHLVGEFLSISSTLQTAECLGVRRGKGSALLTEVPRPMDPHVQVYEWSSLPFQISLPVGDFLVLFPCSSQTEPLVHLQK